MFERFDVARKTEAAAKSMKQVQDTIRLLKSSGMTRNSKMQLRNSELSASNERAETAPTYSKPSKGSGAKAVGMSVGQTKVSKLIIHPNTKHNIDSKADTQFQTLKTEKTKSTATNSRPFSSTTFKSSTKASRTPNNTKSNNLYLQKRLGLHSRN